MADSCRESATDGLPGVAEIATELRDANARVTIDVPCIIHLVDGADVTLANVQLHDSDPEPARPRHRLRIEQGDSGSLYGHRYR